MFSFKNTIKKIPFIFKAIKLYTMKKTIFLILTISLIINLKAQKAVGNAKDLAAFFKTTTCLVTEQDDFSPYNGIMQKAMKEFWTITPYQVISYSDFDKMKNKSQYSFIVLTTVYPDKKFDIQYNALSVVMGAPGKRFEELPEIGSFPLTFYNQDDWQYLNKIGSILLFLQNHIRITSENKNLNQFTILNYYKKNTPSLKNKTIYFTEDQLDKDVNTIEQIQKIYKGDVKIVESAEIEKIVYNKDENAVLAHIVTSEETTSNTIKSFKYLIGAFDGKLYYIEEKTTTKDQKFMFYKSDFSNFK